MSRLQDMRTQVVLGDIKVLIESYTRAVLDESTSLPHLERVAEMLLNGVWKNLGKDNLKAKIQVEVLDN